MEQFRKARKLAAAFISAGAILAAAQHPRAAAGATFGPTPSPAPSASAAAATPAPAPPPAGSDAEAKARAKEWIGRFQSGDIDRSQLTPAFSATLDSATIAQIKSVLPKGAPLSVSLISRTSDADQTYYIYAVTWNEGTLSFSFGLTAGGKIGTAYFRQT